MSDRKYRHRGYQDDDRDREQQQRQRPKTDGVKRFDGAPRGRGLGAPTTVAFKCARCGHELVDPRIEKDTTCSSCGSALHCCTNCSFFNTGAQFECRKPITARVESKTKANDCTYFEPKAVRDLKVKATPDGPDGPADPHAAFHALFKK